MGTALYEYLYFILVLLVVELPLQQLVGLAVLRQTVYFMEEYLPTNLVIYVLYYESVDLVYEAVGTKITIYLLEEAKSLSHVHTRLAYDLRMFL